MSQNQDPTSESRKKDHIDLALRSQTSTSTIDDRFYYEPMMCNNDKSTQGLRKNFLGCDFGAPIWISSMTGGTAMAGQINKNLALICKDFGLGMGLGSCRRLLYDDTFIKDFAIRSFIGDRPLYINLGIAQVEQLVKEKKISKIKELINKLEANGMIIHINPLQEWLQPEGDVYHDAPIDTIGRLLMEVEFPIIVKEVGHGMGIESIRQLAALPIAALDFGAFGGTNFSKIEMARASEITNDSFGVFSYVGHTAEDMVDMVNVLSLDKTLLCKEIIISGGVRNFLDGYYLTQKCTLSSIYAMAAGFLKYAKDDYESLYIYTKQQIEGLALASKLLKIRNSK